MQVFDNYIRKHEVKPLFPRKKHKLQTGIVIVIPCYDEGDLDKTLSSLLKCEDPGCRTEVIVIVNSGENTPQEIRQTNRESYFQLLSFKEKYSTDHIGFNPVLVENIRHKHAGVGMARKIGMDQAILMFREEGLENGIILSLDADTLVEKNYLKSASNNFHERKLELACIDFLHPLSGTEFEEDVYKGITLYELHLRYVRLALNTSRFPYDMHTVGSAFAVTALAYVKHGGMNRKQGGEDFYFLHKVRPHVKFGEIMDTTVHPSPRPSDRVPFGTGPKIAEWCDTKRLMTYEFKVFDDLKQLFSDLDQFYGMDKKAFKLYVDKLSEPLQTFLNEDGFKDNLAEINANSGSQEGFKKRFFLNFSAFKVIKYLNYAHEHYYAKKEVMDMCDVLFDYFGISDMGTTPLTYLNRLRAIEQAMF